MWEVTLLNLYPTPKSCQNFRREAEFAKSLHVTWDQGPHAGHRNPEAGKTALGHWGSKKAFRPPGQGFAGDQTQ